MRLVFSVLLLFSAITMVSAQKKLFITPSLGMQLLTDYALELPDDDNFRYNGFRLYPDFGVHVQYELNERWAVFGGWNNGGIGYSFTLLNENKQLLLRYSNTFPAQRFPLGVQRHLGTVKLFKSKRRLNISKNLKVTTTEVTDDMLYLLLFRTRIIFGGTLDYMVPTTGDNVKESYANRDIEFRAANTIEQRWGPSLFLGLNLQFFNYNKDNFQLIFFYSQGVKRKTKLDLEYDRLNDRSTYQSSVGTRGSYVGIQLAYPIKVKEFKSKSFY
ncbi:hypothetical protein [Fulvivirga ligni]|uniref:hypothetical protein n=1 Tax=Fulvivirga ligni TaxID=2904246 RepID=UPI001F3B521D|nr:hypothetical protein [Fulvivirga ligni]UII20308.1 hypothetical protein LVD16_20915 [Fulvivirga ligni]